MKTRLILFLVLVIFLSISFVGVSNQITSDTKHNPSLPPLRGQWLYVGGNGIGNYTRIQDAIDSASDGDTVFVYSGWYTENLVINKSIIVSGEERNTTVIIGQNDSEIVLINKSDVEFMRFTIQRNNETNLIGIMIRNCVSSHIHEITVKSCYYGILVVETESVILSDNSILGCFYGIQNVITGNLTITRNRIDGNGEGVGIEVQVTRFRNYIKRNSITNNSIGVSLIFTAYSDVRENNFFENQQSAFFIDSFFNGWHRNYWNQSYRFPKIIPGQLGGLLIPRTISLINFDWHPAMEPYNILDMN